jgi:hypothetical protein
MIIGPYKASVLDSTALKALPVKLIGAQATLLGINGGGMTLSHRDSIPLAGRGVIWYPKGTNTDTVWVHDEYIRSGIINATWAGASDIDTLSDSDAMQRAVDAASDGSTIVLPKKTPSGAYVWGKNANRQVLFEGKDNLTIRLEGNSQCLPSFPRGDTTHGTIFEAKDCDNFTLEIIGDFNGRAAEWDSCVYAAAGTRAFLWFHENTGQPKNVKILGMGGVIRNWPGDGLWIQRTSGVTVTGVKTDSVIEGMVFVECTNGLVEGNFIGERILNGTPAQTASDIQDGIEPSYCTDFVIRGNFDLASQLASAQAPTNTFIDVWHSRNVTVDGNHSPNPSSIEIIQSNGVSVTSNRFFNLVLSLTSTADTDSNVVISNNVFQNDSLINPVSAQPYYCIFSWKQDSTHNGLRITNNIFEASYGVRHFGNGRGVIIDGNTFKARPGVSYGATAISLEAAYLAPITPTSFVKITNNTIDRFNIGVRLADATDSNFTVDSVEFRGNRFPYAQEVGQRLYDPDSLKGDNWYVGDNDRATYTETDTLVAEQYRVLTPNTAPSNPTTAGTQGEIRYTVDGIYECISDNVWRKATVEKWISFNDVTGFLLWVNGSSIQDGNSVTGPSGLQPANADTAEWWVSIAPPIADSTYRYQQVAGTTPITYHEDIVNGYSIARFAGKTSWFELNRLKSGSGGARVLADSSYRLFFAFNPTNRDSQHLFVNGTATRGIFYDSTATGNRIRITDDSTTMTSAVLTVSAGTFQLIEIEKKNSAYKVYQNGTLISSLTGFSGRGGGFNRISLNVNNGLFADVGEVVYYNTGNDSAHTIGNEILLIKYEIIDGIFGDYEITGNLTVGGTILGHSIDSIANLAGAGVGVYKLGSLNQLKRLKAGFGLTVTDNTDSVTYTVDSTKVATKFDADSLYVILRDSVRVLRDSLRQTSVNTGSDSLSFGDSLQVTFTGLTATSIVVANFVDLAIADTLFGTLSITHRQTDKFTIQHKTDRVLGLSPRGKFVVYGILKK